MRDTWTNDAAFLDDVGDVADLAEGLIGIEKEEAGKCSMLHASPTSPLPMACHRMVMWPTKTRERGKEKMNFHV